VEALVAKYINDLGTNIKLFSLRNPKSKNKCAGERHQKFAAILHYATPTKSNTKETQNNCAKEYCFWIINMALGARGSVVVKALCYKPEGRGFETR
jgi:hypothetical protein